MKLQELIKSNELIHLTLHLFSFALNQSLINTDMFLCHDVTVTFIKPKLAKDLLFLSYPSFH